MNSFVFLVLAVFVFLNATFGVFPTDELVHYSRINHHSTSYPSHSTHLAHSIHSASHFPTLSYRFHPTIHCSIRYRLAALVSRFRASLFAAPDCVEESFRLVKVLCACVWGVILIFSWFGQFGIFAGASGLRNNIHVITPGVIFQSCIPACQPKVSIQSLFKWPHRIRNIVSSIL